MVHCLDLVPPLFARPPDALGGRALFWRPDYPILRRMDDVSRNLLAVVASRCREDFHAFVEFVGVDHEGNPMRQAALHRLIWDFEAWCAERRLYAGIMAPMGHGKTSQCEYRAAWEIGRDPNTLLRFVRSSDDKARESAGAVRSIMALPRYRVVFPGLKMVKGESGESEFTLERTGVSKDPTFGCSGVLTGTGSRCTLLMLDDIVDQRNAFSADRDKVAEHFESTWMSRPIRAGSKPSRVVWIQTAYHNDDIAARVQGRADSGWAWLIVRALEPYEELRYELHAYGRLVQEGPLANFIGARELALMAGSMNTVAAARGLGNYPLSGKERKFDESLFTGPAPLQPGRYHRRVAYLDPAGDAKKAKRGDPDWCAMVMLGKHPAEPCWDVACSDRMRGTSSQQADWCAERVQVWGVQVLYVEAVADGAMPQLVQDALVRRGVYVVPKRVQPRRKKVFRIEEEVEPRLRGKLLRVNREAHRALCEEAIVFPLGAHDDLLDALAGAAEHGMGAGPARHRSSVKAAPEASGRGRRRPFPRVKVWERHRVAP